VGAGHETPPLDCTPALGRADHWSMNQLPASFTRQVAPPQIPAASSGSNDRCCDSKTASLDWCVFVPCLETWKKDHGKPPQTFHGPQSTVGGCPLLGTSGLSNDVVSLANMPSLSTTYGYAYTPRTSSQDGQFFSPQPPPRLIFTTVRSEIEPRAAGRRPCPAIFIGSDMNEHVKCAPSAAIECSELVIAPALHSSTTWTRQTIKSSLQEKSEDYFRNKTEGAWLRKTERA